MKYSLRSISVVAFIMATAAFFYFRGCGQHPVVSVSAKVEGNRVVFHIPHYDVHGLLGFEVSDSQGVVLWRISLPYEKGHSITYGVLPKGGNMAATQEIPPAPTSPPPIRGKTVVVRVDYQYDADFSPSIGSIRQQLDIP
jgi:hypothetical protein